MMPLAEPPAEGTDLADRRYHHRRATLAPGGQYVAICAAPREIHGPIRFAF